MCGEKRALLGEIIDFSFLSINCVYDEYKRTAVRNWHIRTRLRVHECESRVSGTNEGCKKLFTSHETNTNRLAN